MKSIISTFAIAAAVVISTGSSFAGEAALEGTMNNVNIRLTCQFPGQPQTNTNLRTERTTVRAETTRINNATVIGWAVQDESISNPNGWRIVQVFDEGGNNLGLFFYRNGYPPISIPDSYISWTDPTDVFETYSETENIEDSELVQDDRRALGTLNVQVNGKDVSGIMNQVSRLRTIRTSQNNIKYYTVTSTSNVSGVTVQESGNVYAFGTITSSGGNRLVPIQGFVDAMNEVVAAAE